MFSGENRTRNWKAIRIQAGYFHIPAQTLSSLWDHSLFPLFLWSHLQSLSSDNSSNFFVPIIEESHSKPLNLQLLQEIAKTGPNSKFLRGRWSTQLGEEASIPFWISYSWASRIHRVETGSKAQPSKNWEKRRFVIHCSAFFLLLLLLPLPHPLPCPPPCPPLIYICMQKMLGLKRRTSGRSASVLNYWTISNRGNTLKYRTPENR